MTNSSEWLSLRQAARLIGLDPRTVRARITAGELPAYRVGPKKFRILRSDLFRLLRRVEPVEVEVAK